MGTSSINYQIDLDPNDFGQQSDALFHLGEGYPLAHGKLDGVGWECRLSNCGEQRLYDKEGNRIGNDDLVNIYDSDKELSEAIDKDEITIDNNSWWELEFFRVDESSDWYLDLFMALDDTCIVDSPKDAIETFKALMSDKAFIKDLKIALKGLRSEKGETDM